MSVYDEQPNDKFIQSQPSNVGSIQNFKKIIVGAGSEKFEVSDEGLFMGAETYADAPVKIPFTGKIKVGSATIYFEWDGSAFNVVGGTITGGIIQTATTGYRLRLNGSNNKIELLYNDTVKGSISLDGSNSVIIDSADNIYLSNGANMLAQFVDGNINIPADKSLIIGGYSGKSFSTRILTAIDYDGEQLRYKYRDLTYTGGIVTDKGTESGWNNVS